MLFRCALSALKSHIFIYQISYAYQRTALLKRLFFSIVQWLVLLASGFLRSANATIPLQQAADPGIHAAVKGLTMAISRCIHQV